MPSGPTPIGVVVEIGLWSGMVECFLGFDVAADRSIRTPASETVASTP
jgi:hypothetical protein